LAGPGPLHLHWLSLGDVLRENRRSHPRRTAWVCGGERATHPELDLRTTRLASALARAGVGAGDRVLWLGQNCHRVLEGLLAAAKLGAVLCPANWRLGAEELAFVLEDCDPRVVLWQEQEIGEAVRGARARAGARALWIQSDAGGPGSYEDFLAGGSSEDPELPVDPASPVLALYTAAFSGRPSAALLSHRAILVQDLVLATVQRLSCESVYLNAGPLFHIGTFQSTLATFHLGGCNVFTRRADPEEICRLVEAERCTGAYLVGPTIERILELNRDGRYDLSSLRSFPGPPEWNAMVTIDESPWGRHPAGYGQTELTGLLTFNALGAGARGASGRPSPLARVRILDEAGRELPPGETGEIAVRGPSVMNGYLGRPDLDAARRAHGWHRTHDLGRREADGSISFVGPKTRLIKSASENIYPLEVESCLASHPAVAECAVIGVPDPRWVQSVLAVVVLREGARASEEELVRHCRERMASYKKPRRVAFLDALPRRGRAVDYDALDARFGGGGYPGGRSPAAIAADQARRAEPGA
jgi:long-chain acyl-CoA synthetase